MKIPFLATMSPIRTFSESQEEIAAKSVTYAPAFALTNPVAVILRDIADKRLHREQIATVYAALITCCGEDALRKTVRQ